MSDDDSDFRYQGSADDLASILGLHVTSANLIKYPNKMRRCKVVKAHIKSNMKMLRSLAEVRALITQLECHIACMVCGLHMLCYIGITCAVHITRV